MMDAYIGYVVGKEIIEMVIGVDYDDFNDNEDEIIQQLEAEELFKGE